MRFWQENPELLDEITIKALPIEWRSKIDEGDIDLDDVPQSIRYKAMAEGKRITGLQRLMKLE